MSNDLTGVPTFASGPGLGLANWALPQEVSPPTEAPPPAMSDADARQAVLDRIASGEAPDYTTIYGGHKFSSFADHPRISVPITSGPNTGKYSTAAGRYQFLGSTWDAQAKKLGLTDFSPDSQDAAALDLAQTTYKAQTGRDILADAKAGKVNWGALGSQWESLQGASTGPGGGTSGAKPVSHDTASVTVAQPGVPPTSPTANPLTTMLGLTSTLGRPGAKFTPVDYDPFKYLPRLGNG